MYRITASNTAFTFKGEFVVEDTTTFRQWNRGGRGRIVLVHRKGKDLEQLVANVAGAAPASNPQIKVELVEKRQAQDLNYRHVRKSAAAIASHLEDFIVKHSEKHGETDRHPMAAMTKAEYEKQFEQDDD